MDPIHTGFDIDRVAWPPTAVIATDYILHGQAVDAPAQAQSQAFFWPNGLLDPESSLILIRNRVKHLMRTSRIGAGSRQPPAQVISSRGFVLLARVHQIRP